MTNVTRISGEPEDVVSARAVLERHLSEISKEMCALSDWLYWHPEPSFEEFQAVEQLTGVLKKYGFETETGVPGLEKVWPEYDRLKYVGGLPKSYDGPPYLPTAFRAKYKGKNEHPVIAAVVEYDALRGNPVFHGCQHNMQGPIGIGACIAIAKTLEELELPGSVWVIGAPAEEVGPPAKAAMAKAGYIDGIDFAMRSHSVELRNETVRNPGGFTARHIEMTKFTFRGKSAHAQEPWTGVSALDAVLLLIHGLEMLREHSEPQFRFHWTITEGGVAPNIIPETASVNIWVRHLTDKTRVGNVSPRRAKEMISAKVAQLDRLAKGIADGTGTEVEIDHYGSYMPAVSVGAMNDLMFDYGIAYGGVNPTEAQVPRHWEESGLMSLKVPGVTVGVGTPGLTVAPAEHSQENADLTITEEGHRCLVLTMKVMAATGLRIMMDPIIQNKIKEEHSMLVRKYNE
jgi:amidohydrolase